MNDADNSDVRPLLIGLLVDVSASMGQQLSNGSGATVTRIESLESSLEELVSHARSFCDELAPTHSPFDIFALGFGFGNLRDNLLTVFGKKNVPAVRSLLTESAAQPIVDGLAFLERWREHRATIHELAKHMGGDTPLVEAAKTSESIFLNAFADEKYSRPGVLFIVSDGMPTDPPDQGPELVRSTCERIRALDVALVSCFVTSDDETAHKTLYSSAQKNWSDGASLMFDCASSLTPSSPFLPHLREYRWDAPVGSKLFGQVNQSETLDDFVRLVVAPIDRQTSPARGTAPVRVFVSYSHHDEKYVSDDKGSLLSYLRGLQEEGVVFWHDRHIATGDIWDDHIRQELSSADIALVLVSQAFLTSAYCMSVEAPAFIARRRERGLRILPVILSPCDWRRQGWLAETQALPLGGKTIERDFSTPGRRKELYLEVLDAIRKCADDVRSAKIAKVEHG